MLSLTSLTVTTYDANKLTVTWDFKSTSENLSDYVIDVYRSETPGTSGVGEYTLVGSGISADTASYDDITVSGLFHPTRTWFYKIKLTNNSTSASAILFNTTPAYIKSHTLDKYTLEIIRRKKQVQDKFAGRPVYLLRRKTYGQRCPTCWDSTLFRRTKDDDVTCFGTGIVGGYFSPQTNYAILTSSPKYNQITMFGEWFPSDIMMNIVGIQPLKISDIVVDDAAKRWLVKSINTVEKGGVIIEQTCQLSLISPSDIVYTIAVTS